MTAVATVDCPLCQTTVLGRGPSTVAATSAAIDALDGHLAEHTPGSLASPREPSRILDSHETDRNTI